MAVQEVPFPITYVRQSTTPIDKDSVFATTAARLAYLGSPRRYAGQIVTDVEQNKAYVLNNTRDVWLPVVAENIDKILIEGLYSFDESTLEATFTGWTFSKNGGLYNNQSGSVILDSIGEISRVDLIVWDETNGFQKITGEEGEVTQIPMSFSSVIPLKMYLRLVTVEEVFEDSKFIGREGIKTIVNEGESVTIETEFTSELDDSLVTVGVGGLASTTLGNLKHQSLRKIIEDIVAPTQLPTYTIPTIVISSSTSLSATREVGETFVTTLTVTAIKNDAGAYSQLVVRRGGSVLKTDGSPTQSAATAIAAQFGFADPNNPNYSYVTTYSESITVPSTATTWSAIGDYGAGLPKKSNKNVTDARTPAVRNVNAPQAAASSFASSNITLNSNFRYFAGQGASLPADGAGVRTMLLSTSTIGQPSGNWDIVTDGTSTNFVIAIPNNRSLTQVKNMNTNENLSFTLSGSITTVPDANNANQNYRVYTLTTGVAFGAGNVLRITIA